jgi:hypothetical protein
MEVNAKCGHLKKGGGGVLGSWVLLQSIYCTAGVLHSISDQIQNLQTSNKILGGVRASDKSTPAAKFL